MALFRNTVGGVCFSIFPFHFLFLFLNNWVGFAIILPTPPGPAPIGRPGIPGLRRGTNAFVLCSQGVNIPVCPICPEGRRSNGIWELGPPIDGIVWNPGCIGSPWGGNPPNPGCCGPWFISLENPLPNLPPTLLPEPIISPVSLCGVDLSLLALNFEGALFSCSCSNPFKASVNVIGFFCSFFFGLFPDLKIQFLGCWSTTSL